MFESFCTSLGFVIVFAAAMAVVAFVVAALIIGFMEIFSKKR